MPSPTGDCFEAAAKLLLEVGSDALKLVHGEVTGQGPIEGLRYGHAWVEAGDWVLDHSNGKELCVPREVYYRVGEIADNRHEYDLKTARHLMMETGHFGPWDLQTESGL
jgi:hypothetical protein